MVQFCKLFNVGTLEMEQAKHKCEQQGLQGNGDLTGGKDWT